jgi:hypothetical protein
VHFCQRSRVTPGIYTFAACSSNGCVLKSTRSLLLLQCYRGKNTVVLLPASAGAFFACQTETRA